MKIVNLETFRALPSGTIFMKYLPCIFSSLSVKGDTLGRDFIYAEIVSDIDSQDSGDYTEKLHMAEHYGASVPVSFSGYMRDGCFDDDQLFAIYEKTDVEGLITKLQQSLAEAYK